jgi:hypothetical protein
MTRRSGALAGASLVILILASTTATGAAPRASHPVLYVSHTGHPAAEPTLGITPDGAVFFQAEDVTNGVSPVSDILRSSDDGRTWQVVSPMLGPIRRHPQSEDPYLYVDPVTGRVFTADLFIPGCSELSWSDDGGTTWTTSIAGCGTFDHETIFAGPPVTSHPRGYPNVVYYCAIDGGAAIPTSTMTVCEKSLDGGLTWIPTGRPPYVADPGGQPDGTYGIAGACDGGTGHGIVAPDGTIYLPRGYCGQPFLAISHDEGRSWTRVQVSTLGMPKTSDNVFEHEAAVGIDPHGNLFYFWLAHDRLPYLAHSRDGGRIWSKPLMVGTPGLTEAALPAMASGPRGEVAFVYMGSTNSPGAPFPGEGECTPTSHPIGFVIGCAAAAAYDHVTWNGYIGITRNPLAAHPTIYAGTVNDPGHPLVRGTCGPIRCQQEFDFLDVQFGPDRSAWGAFVDAEGLGIVGRVFFVR